MTLVQERCEVCQEGAPAVTPEEIPSLLQEIPQWRLEQVEGVAQLTRTFAFKNFKEAIAFTNKVGEIAEAAQHHPALLTEWGKVKVNWWTHKIAGVHRNDFIMAAKTDAL